MKNPLPAHVARRLAVKCDNCDPRSIQKCARGESVAGHLGETIRRALEAEGLLANAVDSHNDREA
jgi:hypothetical protein